MRLLKKYAGILGVLVLAYAISAPGLQRSGLVRSMRPEQFRNFAEDYTNATATIPDARPRMYMRFDDGTANQYLDNHIQYTMSLGLDVTLAIDPAAVEAGNGLEVISRLFQYLG